MIYLIGTSKSQPNKAVNCAMTKVALLSSSIPHSWTTFVDQGALILQVGACLRMDDATDTIQEPATQEVQILPAVDVFNLHGSMNGNGNHVVQLLTTFKRKHTDVCLFRIVS